MSINLFTTNRLSELFFYAKRASQIESFSEKRKIFEKDMEIEVFAKKCQNFIFQIQNLSPLDQYILLELVVIGQGFSLIDPILHSPAKIQALLRLLNPVEKFYSSIGGIIGYHAKLTSLMQNQQQEHTFPFFQKPSLVDFSKEGQYKKDLIEKGIEAMPYFAEIYPLGGAADRLHLEDENTGQALPAAKLSIGGKTLLEFLITDVQAREHLYFKKYGKTIHVPIVIMASHEKNNYHHILSILEKKNWFNRPKESYKIIIQPVVPTVSQDGSWCVKENHLPLMKPSGHGVLWKLMQDEKVFDWLLQMNKKKAIVRQINNPLVGVDATLLALAGYGCKNNSSFGFLCTNREKKAQEGAIVIKEERKEKKIKRSLTNVEYCDFVKYGVDPSFFPSNTNVLFVDIEDVAQAVIKEPFPGTLVNIKKTVVKENNCTIEKKIGRLESTMQNIADQFYETEEKSIVGKCFAAFHQREKAISTTKKVYYPGGSLLETPEKCFYDLAYASWDLLTKYCDIHAPSFSSLQEYLKNGPSIYFSYHPALGPLFFDIAKKIYGGKIAKGSFFQIEASEVSIKNIDLKGACIIQASAIMGKTLHKNLCYSEEKGRCILENVVIENKGVSWQQKSPFWKSLPKPKEKLQIILQGNSAFYAKNLRISGDFTFVVEDGKKVEAFDNNGKIDYKETNLRQK